MSSSGLDISQLSDSEKSALETYIAVTGQEPSEAIPLLRRSEWNVQIAISKFFDGEAPDPLEEARAALNNPPPPRPSRQTQNLMSDDLTARFSPAAQTSEPAPHITTQPEDQTAYRPPFLLALLFTPFNLIYRLLCGSFRLFSTLFPFLPRLLNTTVNPALQSARRNTTGRRALGPQDTAARFIREFEEEYRSNSIGFLENGYNMALEKAHRDLKFLLVVLLSPEHDDTNRWVRDTLLSPEVTEFVNDPQNDVLVWGGNVQDSEAYQVSNSLRCTKFPFAAAIVHTPNVSSTAMSVVCRISGLTSPSEFVEKLRTAITQHKEALERLRASRAEQQASRSLREQQDSAYERSLAIDRERARQRREAEAAQQRAEQEAADRQAAEEKRIRDLQQWKQWRAQSIQDEPGADVKDAIRISIRLPSGERVIRKFAPEADLEELYAFVECYEVLQEAQGQEKPVGAEKPDGFAHQYGFRLVSPMPRTVYEVAAGGTIRDKIGRGGNLLVEPIEDDSDEEEP
ncbi:clathrin-mediated endocytosis regulator UBX3 [Aspergillus clavatus NRRL 1]|uniref:UBX domain protein n=1 Tax=Aspergillus clavatus (strain ATCC 1007 / CBS 513.65 / DSM 816 / NCTC 3887 / NRRL 1 / QM 1276 / 107) TaxID=344612 RepID=A1CP30_ASPCL|nr:UBX domain protein [Aspergillus clavatus NRRL 1]EAW07401.1 UBX domain protein [Aspergillus clavatus NRRL 1]